MVKAQYFCPFFFEGRDNEEAAATFLWRLVMQGNWSVLRYLLDSMDRAWVKTGNGVGPGLAVNFFQVVI